MKTTKHTRIPLCVKLLAFVRGLTSCKSKQTEEQLKKAPAPKRQGWDKFPLYGDVAKVTEKRNGVVDYIYYFNANGDVSKYKYYFDGELDGRRTYRYDSAGNLIEFVGYDSSEVLYERYTYRYRYDSAGNQIEGLSYNSFGELLRKYTYRYDSAGNRIEQVRYNSDGELDWRDTYRYDSAGNQIEILGYDSSGKLWKRNTYRYDSAGNLIEEAEYYYDGEWWWRFTYRYDSAGNLNEKEVWRDYDGELRKNRYTYRYGSAGNPIEMLAYNSDGEMYVRYTYEIEYR